MSIITVIYIPSRKAIIYVYEEKIFNMEVTVIMNQKLTRSTIIFSHTAATPLMKRITMRRIELLKIGNGNLSQMIWKFLIYHIIIMVPMG